MLAIIRDDTWNVLNMQHIILQILKDGVIQPSTVVAINRIKDPPTRLKVATAFEKPPTLTQCHGVDTKYLREIFKGNVP